MGCPEGYFVDWITITQYHGVGDVNASDARTELMSDPSASILVKDGPVPELFGKLTMVMSADGTESYESATGVQVRASYDTSMRIRSYEGRVTVSGNPSRWGRPDNLFGFDLGECLEIINDELSRHDLPPFSVGEPICDQDAEQVRADLPPRWTGAAVSEIHITRNYSAGSDFLAGLAIRAYAAKSRARMKKAVYGSETAMWSTQRRTVKAYRKGPEMRVHAKQSPWSDWANEHGIVRHEVEIHSKHLSETRLRYLGNLTMGELIKIHRLETEHLTKIDATLDPMAVEHITSKSRLVYAAWLRGEAVRDMLTRATFYRHRKAIMESAGIDIAEDRVMVANVVQLPARTVTLVPAAAPEGYWLRAA